MEIDVNQAISMSSGLTQWQAQSEAQANLLRKTLDSQADTITTLVQSVAAPSLPSNPAIGRNINTTA